MNKSGTDGQTNGSDDNTPSASRPRGNKNMRKARLLYLKIT